MHNDMPGGVVRADYFGFTIVVEHVRSARLLRAANWVEVLDGGTEAPGVVSVRSAPSDPCVT